LPSHLRDFIFWSELDKAMANSSLRGIGENFQHCMLIGGSGSRMRGVSDLQKHMIPVDGKPMFKLVADIFDTKKTLIFGAPDIDLGSDDLPNSYSVKLFEKKTASHLESLTRAVKVLEKGVPVLFTSCDCYGSVNALELMEKITKFNPDAVVFSFEPSLMHKKNANQHTTILVNEECVIDVDIKSKNKNYSKGLAGFFWFKDTSLILEQLAISQGNQEGELLVDHLIEGMVKNKKKVMCMQIDPYIHLGTPNEYFEYNYWNGRGKCIASLADCSANG
jgi:GTP:adenosylcobinamide-phosphate guanylyltransferase